MHHSLRLYRRYQGTFLRFYILGGRLTRLPGVGRLVRALATQYGYRAHSSYTLTLAQARQVVEGSPEVFLGPCRCRQVFHHCQAPLRAELVIGRGARVFPQEHPGEYERISQGQALALLEESHRQGLFHTLMRCGAEAYALCNCCRCCCVPTRLRSAYGIRGALLPFKAGS